MARTANPWLVQAIWIVLIFFSSAGAWAQDYAPTRKGGSLNLGYTYDPSEHIWFSQVSFFSLYDYDKVWRHRAPDNLRFKVEASLGGSRLDNSDIRLNASVNIFALLYLTDPERQGIRPYVEAGIGGIYTDYRVPGQDYRFNFNPQAGIGIEIDAGSGTTYFTAVRLHHLSNAGIGSQNRGQNSVVGLFGRYF